MYNVTVNTGKALIVIEKIKAASEEEAIQYAVRQFKEAKINITLHPEKWCKVTKVNTHESTHDSIRR